MMVWLEGPRLGLGGAMRSEAGATACCCLVWLQRNHSRTNSRATQLLSLSLSPDPPSRHQRGPLPQQHTQKEWSSSSRHPSAPATAATTSSQSPNPPKIPSRQKTTPRKRGGSPSSP